MADLIPINVTLEITKMERRIIVINPDDFYRDGYADLNNVNDLVDFIKGTPNWQQRFGGDDTSVLELDVIHAMPHPIKEGDPPR